MGAGIELSRTEVAELRAVLSLRRQAGLGDRGLTDLIARAGSARKVLRERGIQIDALDQEEPNSDIDSWIRHGYLPLPITSNRYPNGLRALTDPPPLIFLRGVLDYLRRPAVAIVGSRKTSGAGRRMAERIGRVLASRGIAVVSGMALGVDGAAHRGALGVEGPTIAVLGSGIDTPYPASHRKLFHQIADSGLLISEFLPGAPALRHHFPKRNRIIAALACAIVVVEAGERSGALITVDHGLDLGREIFAVPGSVENPQARGSNALLADGAGVLTHPDEFLDDLQASGLLPAGFESLEGSTTGDLPPIPPDLLPVFSVLSTEPAPLESIAKGAGVEAGAAMADLTSLELGGWAEACPGFHYRTAGEAKGRGPVPYPSLRGH